MLSHFNGWLAREYFESGNKVDPVSWTELKQS